MSITAKTSRILLCLWLIAASLFPLFTLFVLIPRYFVVPIILLGVTFLYLNIKVEQNFPVISSFLTVAVFFWLLWASICWPYWNSSILAELCKFRYPYTESPHKRISRRKAVFDYESAYHYVKSTHPVFLLGGNDSFEKQHEIGLSDLLTIDSVSINELHIRIQKMLSKLEDGHTRAFPIYKELHTISFRDYGIPISINGTSIDTILYEKQGFYSSETISYKRTKLLDDIRTYEGLLFLGINPDLGVLFQFQDSNGNTKDVFFKKNDFRVNDTSKYDDKNVVGGYSVLIDNNIAYFRLDNCQIYLPWELNNFSHYVNTFFDDVAKNSIENIVIDLRGNYGGNPNVWKYFLKYLPLDSVDMGVRHLRRGPLLIKRKWVMNISHSHNPFCGRIFVLSSTRTFSAAMEFAYCLQRHYHATIVGESPGNAINCYSNMVNFVLPESNLSLSVSSERFSKGDSVARVIIPDIYCSSEKAYDMVINKITVE